MRLLLLLLFLLAIVDANAAMHGYCYGCGPASQVNANFIGGSNGEYQFLNSMKTVQAWTYGDNSAHPGPTELDSNGFPLFGATAFSHGGLKSVFPEPSQAERSGSYVLTWVGAGKLELSDQNGGSSGSSCTGTAGAPSNTACDNSACTALTGAISATVLTVTIAPTGTGCSLVIGQPISGSGVTVSQFGVPTIITGNNTSGSTACGGVACTGSGGTGTYRVNWSQTVASESMNPGGRLVTAGSSSEGATTDATWHVSIDTTVSGNTAQYLGIYHVNDEPTYWTGQIAGVLFKKRINQGNFATLRDLNLTFANHANCTTWATRKPGAYYTYQDPEMRSSVYVGTGGIPGSSISYNAGTDTYSITAASGNWTDKEFFIVQFPANGTTSSKISLNGNTAVPILSPFGSTNGTAWGSGAWAGMWYDATIGGVLTLGGTATDSYEGLNCGMPPEAFIELCHELGVDPWIVAFFPAVDPMTDFYTQYATYIKTNFATMRPEFEIPDEPWNGIQFPGCYFSAKSRAYILLDSAWSNGSRFCGSGGDIVNEAGKVASTLGQAISSVYGSPAQYELIAGIQGHVSPINSFNDELLSTSYMNQNPANIPTQSGYIKAPAYNYVTRVAIDNYWNNTEQGTQAEVADAYCYFTQAAGCASPAAIMSNYMATQYITAQPCTGCGGLTLAQIWGQANTFATTCAGHGSPCNVKGIIGYEGTFTNQGASSDRTATVTSATDASQAVLTVGGCVAGMPINISAASGGTWSTANGNYTVQSATSTTCTINLNSSGLGSLTSLTLTYTGSKNYINWLAQNSYLSPDLQSLSLLAYQQFLANGGIKPSLFTLASLWTSGTGGNPWQAWSFDIYGYYQIATCTSCTISGTTLTLGGTVTGVFQSGQTIFGAGVTTPTTITGGCVLSGTSPCGSNSGDTLTLSQSSTVSVGESMTGNVTPQLDPHGDATDSPITQWKAIRIWNNNAQNFLLKRDLVPAVNDNTPMWIDLVA